jgi:hypothetical protein
MLSLREALLACYRFVLVNRRNIIYKHLAFINTKSSKYSSLLPVDYEKNIAKAFVEATRFIITDSYPNFQVLLKHKNALK